MCSSLLGCGCPRCADPSAWQPLLVAVSIVLFLLALVTPPVPPPAPTPAAPRSRRRPRPGSRPLKGSSSTSSSGSCTSAAASCTRCWFALRQLLDRVVAPLGQSEPTKPGVGPLSRVRPAVAVQPGEVDQRAVGGHLRIQAAFLGHVAEPCPHGLIDELAPPAHLPASSGCRRMTHERGGGVRCSSTVPAPSTTG